MFLTGYAIAMVTSNVIKMTPTFSEKIGHLFDIIIVAAIVNNL